MKKTVWCFQAMRGVLCYDTVNSAWEIVSWFRNANTEII